MEVKKFDGFIWKVRKAFSRMLNDESRHKGMKKFIMRQYERCCSEFEEQTLIENLKEEYGLYLESLAGRAV